MMIWIMKRIWIYHSRQSDNEKDNIYNDPYDVGGRYNVIDVYDVNGQKVSSIVLM